MSKKVVLWIIVILVVIGAIWMIGGKKENVQTGPVKIGALTALSGNNAVYGVMMKAGIDLAVKEVNDQGGINGNKVEVLYEDSQAQPAEAISGYNNLKQQGVKIVSTIFSNVILALAPIASQDGILLINSGATAGDIPKQGDMVISTIPTSAKEVQPIAEYAAKKYKTAGIVYVDTQFGKDQNDAFRKYFEAAGGKIVSSESTPLDNKDFRTALTKIKSVNPEVIFIGTLAKETSLVVKQAREQGIKLPLVTTQTSITVSALKDLGPVANGIILSGPRFDLNSTEAKFDTFRNAFKQANGKDPDYAATTYYESTKMVMEAIGKCGDQDAVCVSKYLRGLKNYSGILGSITFEGTTVTKPIDIKEYKDGSINTI